MAKNLSHEDRIIWQQIAKTVTPLGQNTMSVCGQNSRKYENNIHIPPAPKPRLHHSLNDLQVNNDKKTRRGFVNIDMVIDLHDQTRDQAFSFLKSRINSASRRKFRCVLVITGKGKNLNGILRASLFAWLNDNELRPLIASYAQAHIRHGGAGAFYVFLKPS